MSSSDHGGAERLEVSQVAFLPSETSADKTNMEVVQLTLPPTRIVRVSDKIPASDIEILKMIGHGGMGLVYQGQWLGMTVAVKVAVEPSKQRDLQREADLLAQLRHPCVCGFYGTASLNGGMAVIMEYLEIGSVYQLLHGKPRRELDIALLLRIAHETAAGIAYLHGNDILHRDVKTANVLLDGLLHAKVADFGVSSSQVEIISQAALDPTRGMHTAGVGTPRYMAPEVIGGSRVARVPYDEKCDVYSFGFLLWELFHGEIAFSGSEGKRVATVLAPAGQRPSLDGLPPAAAPLGKMISACWAHAAHSRPKMADSTTELREFCRHAPGNTRLPAKLGEVLGETPPAKREMDQGAGDSETGRSPPPNSRDALSEPRSGLSELERLWSRAFSSSASALASAVASRSRLASPRPASVSSLDLSALEDRGTALFNAYVAGRQASVKLARPAAGWPSEGYRDWFSSNLASDSLAASSQSLNSSVGLLPSFAAVHEPDPSAGCFEMPLPLSEVTTKLPLSARFGYAPRNDLSPSRDASLVSAGGTEHKTIYPSPEASQDGHVLSEGALGKTKPNQDYRKSRTYPGVCCR